MTSTAPPAGAEWPMDATKYDLTGKIGQGAFASVWRASTEVTVPSEERKQQPEECAIKVLNLDHVDSNLLHSSESLRPDP